MKNRLRMSGLTRGKTLQRTGKPDGILHSSFFTLHLIKESRLFVFYSQFAVNGSKDALHLS